MVLEAGVPADSQKAEHGLMDARYQDLLDSLFTVFDFHVIASARMPFQSLTLRRPGEDR